MRANELRRGLSTGSALGLNVIDMVGVGPFVTLPLIVGVMGGPQAILGWLMGALLSLCDGLIWSELGTAYPEAGGSYAYLKHLYGEKTLGRAFSFLYAWQLLISAPLSIASGCIGFSQYLSFFLPHASHPFAATSLLWSSCRVERPDADCNGCLWGRNSGSLPQHLRHQSHRALAWDWLSGSRWCSLSSRDLRTSMLIARLTSRLAHFI